MNNNTAYKKKIENIQVTNIRWYSIVCFIYS